MKNMEIIEAITSMVALSEIIDITVKHMSLVCEICRKCGIEEETLTKILNEGAEHYHKIFEPMSLKQLREYLENDTD